MNPLSVLGSLGIESPSADAMDTAAAHPSGVVSTGRRAAKGLTGRPALGAKRKTGAVAGAPDDASSDAFAQALTHAWRPDASPVSRAMAAVAETGVKKMTPSPDRRPSGQTGVDHLHALVVARAEALAGRAHVHDPRQPHLSDRETGTETDGKALSDQRRGRRGERERSTAESAITAQTAPPQAPSDSVLLDAVTRPSSDFETTLSRIEAASALQGAVLPQTAHLHLETASGSDLSLHLRMQGGVADLRIEGAAASLLETREADLRVVLASQGVTLGQVDVLDSRAVTAAGESTQTGGSGSSMQQSSQGGGQGPDSGAGFDRSAALLNGTDRAGGRVSAPRASGVLSGPVVRADGSVVA